MSRTRLVMTVAGVTLGAAAAGCAAGLLWAPASGKELRRRIAWNAGEQWRSAARASNRFIGRAVARAKEEFEHRGSRMAATIASRC